MSLVQVVCWLKVEKILQNIAFAVRISLKSVEFLGNEYFTGFVSGHLSCNVELSMFCKTLSPLLGF